MNVVSASARVSEVHFCHHCVASPLYESRLRVWERPIVMLLPIKPYRCHRCCWRGWKLKSRSTRGPSSPSTEAR